MKIHYPKIAKVYDSETLIKLVTHIDDIPYAEFEVYAEHDVYDSAIVIYLSDIKSDHKKLYRLIEKLESIEIGENFINVVNQVIAEDMNLLKIESGC